MKKVFLFCLVSMLSYLCNGQLTADFSADVVSGCAPLRVQFINRSSGAPTRYKWELGNGSIGSQKDASGVYLSAGNYTVKLTIYQGNDSATITKNNFLTIYGTPSIEFSASPLRGCMPLPVQFIDRSNPRSGTVKSWQWDFGDGFLSTQGNPVHDYNSPGLFKVTLIVENSFGCKSSASKLNYVTVFDSLVARFNVEAPSTCSVPATFKFTDSSYGKGIKSYLWNFGDGTTSTQKDPSHSYTVSGSYPVSLIIENTDGCVDTIKTNSLVNAGNLKADFDLPATGCMGTPVTVVNKSTPFARLDSTRWYFSNGTTSGAIHPFPVFYSAGTYTVKAVSYFGICKDSITKTIVILPKTTANFSGSPLGSCKAPLTVNFTNQTAGGTVVKWDFGNGQTSTAANPSVTYNSMGSYTVTLIVRNANGCLDTLIRRNYVNLKQPAISSIAGLPREGCMPWTNTFSLNVDSPEGISQYTWNFGDGTTATGPNPQHTYTDTGTYTVTATVTTVSGCTSSIQSTVKGGLKPTAAFDGGPKLICPLDIVSFTDHSTGVKDEWFWSFGDGSTSSEANPNHLYTDTGWMTVKLVVYNNGCADSLEKEKFLYVNPPIARFRDSFVCANQFQHFFIDNSIGAKYWRWEIDGKDTIVSQNIEYLFKDTGSHLVKLFVTDSICDHEAKLTVLVIDQRPDFVTSDSGSCRNTIVTFRAQGEELNPLYIQRYRWNFGDGTGAIRTDTNIVVKAFTTAGTYNIRLITTDINGCNDTTLQPLNVRMYGPKANFGPDVNVICGGSVLTLHDSTSFDSTNPIKKWRWNFGIGADQTFTSPPFIKQYDSAGVYDIKLVVEDSLGCRDSITKRSVVTVYKPKAAFVSPDTLVCVASPVRFINRSTGSLLNAAWNFGNDSTSSSYTNVSTSYQAEGKYDVKMVITDSLGCRDSLFKPQYINVANAKADFLVSDSFTTCPPLLVNFTNNSFNNPVNVWDFGNGNSSSLQAPSHTYTVPGTFNVKLIVIGNGGCSDSAFKTIRIQGPSGTFKYDPLNGCPPLQVSFVANTINTNSFTWDFSDGESYVTTDSIVSHTYEIPGSFVPRIILSDDIGCKLPIQGLDTINIKGAKAFIKRIPRFYYCDSVTVHFFDSTVTTDVITSYQWDFGDNTTSSLQNPSHTYLKPGNYVVTLEVRTAGGCVSRDTLVQPVLIVPTPVISIGADSTVCVPTTVQFGGNWHNRDTSTMTWQWRFGNGNSDNSFRPAATSYTNPGRYTIALYATNFYGCADTAQKILIVNDTPRVRAAPAAFICLGDSVNIQATGADQYQWEPVASLNCNICTAVVAKPVNNQLYRVTGTDTNGCKSSATVLIQVKQPIPIEVTNGDTLCVGESIQLRATGAEVYRWSPPTGLSSTTISSPRATPVNTTSYMVVGYDTLGCFYDTGYIRVVVYPIPTFSIAKDTIIAPTGTSSVIQTSSSEDVISWRWSPSTGLSCTDCAEPTVLVARSVTYVARVENQGGCKAQDRLTVIPICNSDNIFIPNTFSPNGDGQNDVFFPRGKGIASIKAMRIYNRWGELVYERQNFVVNDASAGWNGTYKGVALTPDVYVYMIDVLCDNNVVFTIKDNVTLLK